MAQFLNNGAYPTYQETQAMINSNTLTVKEASVMIDTALAKETATRKAADSILEAEIQKIGSASGDGDISELEQKVTALSRDVADVKAITDTYSYSFKKVFGYKGIGILTHVHINSIIPANTSTVIYTATLTAEQANKGIAFVRVFLGVSSYDISALETNCISFFDLPGVCTATYTDETKETITLTISINSPVDIPTVSTLVIFRRNE